MTASFAEFFFLIPDGSNLNLRIRVRMDGGSEEFAFDKFEVEAETLGIPDERIHDVVVAASGNDNSLITT